jgi:hypothetical protein
VGEWRVRMNKSRLSVVFVVLVGMALLAGNAGAATVDCSKAIVTLDMTLNTGMVPDIFGSASAHQALFYYGYDLSLNGTPVGLLSGHYFRVGAAPSTTYLSFDDTIFLLGIGTLYGKASLVNSGGRLGGIVDFIDLMGKRVQLPLLYGVTEDYKKLCLFSE